MGKGHCRGEEFFILYTAGQHRDIVQLQGPCDMAQKGDPFQPWFNQSEGNPRPGRFTDKTGETGAGPDIKQMHLSAIRQQRQKGQRIEKVVLDDLLVGALFGDQIDLPAPAFQLFVIDEEPVNRRLLQLNAEPFTTTLEQRPEIDPGFALLFFLTSGHTIPPGPSTLQPFGHRCGMGSQALQIRQQTDMISVNGQGLTGIADDGALL